MQIKKGDNKNLIISLKDSVGNVISDLPTTTEIIFLFKKCKTDADAEALIIKKKTLAEILIDNPAPGDLKINLDSNDTNITPGNYPVGVKLIYSATRKNEVDLFDKDNVAFDKIKICQNTVEG